MYEVEYLNILVDGENNKMTIPRSRNLVYQTATLSILPQTPTPGRITTKMPPQKEDEPYGHCLLARDNPENRKLFPNGPFGKEAVVDTICPTAGQCPFYNYLDDKPTTQLANDVPIHILIASFRDKLCARYVVLN